MVESSVITVLYCSVKSFYLLLHIVILKALFNYPFAIINVNPSLTSTLVSSAAVELVVGASLPGQFIFSQESKDSLGTRLVAYTKAVEVGRGL